MDRRVTIRYEQTLLNDVRTWLEQLPKEERKEGFIVDVRPDSVVIVVEEDTGRKLVELLKDLGVPYN